MKKEKDSLRSHPANPHHIAQEKPSVDASVYGTVNIRPDVGGRNDQIRQRRIGPGKQ